MGRLSFSLNHLLTHIDQTPLSEDDGEFMQSESNKGLQLT